MEQRIADHREVHVSMPLPVVQQQASRCMDCGVPFCHHACPLGNLIPEWNDLVRREDWERAAQRLHATNNFPEFTGRLCPAPCEPACVLAIAAEPVTIKEIEQSIVDRAFAEGWVRPQPPQLRSGRRVAVVGSGPAGLAAAQQLARAGHEVTVYEKSDEPGGLLRYGIPDFKMGKQLIDRRLEQLRAEGVRFETSCAVGSGITSAELRSRSDAVVLAIGAERGRDAELPGRELRGIHLAMEYLVQCNRRVAGKPILGEEISARGKRVVIIGGGDTAADCLGNAVREQAASIEQLVIYPQPPLQRPEDNPWPQWPLVLRTHPAHEEGGERRWAVLVAGFSGDGGAVRAVRTARVEAKGGGGRAAMMPVPGSEAEMAADLVLLAIGFTGIEGGDLVAELDGRVTGSLIATDDSMSGEGVFAAGDAVLGARLIVDAIADGRRAAAACDRWLRVHP